MKITFVLKDWKSLAGGTRVIAKHAENLKNRGHEVVCVSPPAVKPSFRQQLRSLLQGKLWMNYSKNQPSYFDNTGIPCCTLESQRPVINRDVPDADIVIAGFWKTAEWVASFSENKGVKVYFIQHHEVHDYFPKERVKATYLLPFFKITISQWLVNVLQRQYHDDKVALVPNSVDTQQFYAPPREKQSIPTMGLLYSTTYWKGCHFSLQAFSLAQQKISNLRLVAFGKGKPSSDLPLPKGTRYVQQPEQDKLKSIYASCDAWIFSSRVEGFGLPILEAMACRTPVIATPAGAAPELVNSYTGILVKLDEPQDMAAAICKISRLSPAEWQAMSEAAYNQATQYSWNDATDLFEAALHEALQKRKLNQATN